MKPLGLAEAWTCPHLMSSRFEQLLSQRSVSRSFEGDDRRERVKAGLKKGVEKGGGSNERCQMGLDLKVWNRMTG